MRPELTSLEVRVIGCLLEKQLLALQARLQESGGNN